MQRKKGLAKNPNGRIKKKKLRKDFENAHFNIFVPI